MLAVRWETGGRAGEPFPVLDADLALTPAGPRAALLRLAGVYWARSGEAGYHVATVAVGGFLSRIAETIAGAAG